jgi:hypothetical protein
MALSDSSSAFNFEDDLGNFSGPEPPEVVEPQQPVLRPRHMLPDSVQHSRRVVPVVPSNDFPSKKNNKKRPMKESRPSNNSRRKSSLSARSTPIPTQSQPPPQASSSTSKTSRPHVALKRVEPKPVDPETLSLSAAAVQAMHHRDSKDDFLVRSKLAGMSYKDIRRKGKFTEAESTLRGRFRTLTKHKAARVRKPEWSDKDVSNQLQWFWKYRLTWYRSDFFRKGCVNMGRVWILRLPRSRGSWWPITLPTTVDRITLAMLPVESDGMSFRMNESRDHVPKTFRFV